MLTPTVIPDERFTNQFQGSLVQVFLYVTDECNLRCTQCYYKPWLKTGHAEMPTPVLLSLLTEFRRLGARKLSLLGGEPTLYGQAAGNSSIKVIARNARELGFDFMRIVTNGLFGAELVEGGGFDDFDEVTFSIDGDLPEIHDHLRGRGTFVRTLANVKRTADAGHFVQITTCVHRGNVGRTDDGQLLLDRAIMWAQDQGAKIINFHPLFKMDIPRDSWSGATDIEPRQWISVYDEIRANIDAGRYQIGVRLPQRFVTEQTFNDRPGYFGFCPVKLRERIEVHANGQIHSCALNNGTPIALARFSTDGDRVHIRWEEGPENELGRYPFDIASHHSCAVISREVPGLAPLCISFKPDQDEFAWNTHSVGQRGWA